MVALTVKQTDAPDRDVERGRIVESIDEEEIEYMYCERLLD